MGEWKEAIMPRGQGKVKRKSMKNRAERGIGEWKEAIMPRRQGKTVRRGEKPGLTGRKRRKNN